MIDFNQLKVFGPMPKDSPNLGKKCKVCEKAFVEKDFTTLVAMGPGDDEEQQKNCREGRPYSAIGFHCHLHCITGDHMTESRILQMKKKLVLPGRA